MKNLIAFALLVIIAFFFFLGYHWANNENEKEKKEWQKTERETIRKELIEKAKKNYEDYLRTHGIDTMDYDQRAEWLMSNSAYN